MEPLQLLTFAIVSLLLVMSPGPNGLLIAATVPVSGKRAGFANTVGFVVAFYLHGALSIFGISVLLLNSAAAFLAVKSIGAIYLIWIGIKSLISAFKRNETIGQVQPSAKKTAGKSFADGFLTNALNPKVSMFYVAAFPQFMPIGKNAAMWAALLVVVHSMLAAMWFSSMVMLFNKLASAAKNPVMQRWLKITTGIVFIAFGCKLLTLHNK